MILYALLSCTHTSFLFVFIPSLSGSSPTLWLLDLTLIIFLSLHFALFLFLRHSLFAPPAAPLLLPSFFCCHGHSTCPASPVGPGGMGRASCLLPSPLAPPPRAWARPGGTDALQHCSDPRRLRGSGRGGSDSGRRQGPVSRLWPSAQQLRRECCHQVGLC